jgi:hypothetical protein
LPSGNGAAAVAQRTVWYVENNDLERALREWSRDADPELQSVASAFVVEATRHVRLRQLVRLVVARMCALFVDRRVSCARSLARLGGDCVVGVVEAELKSRTTQ